MRFLRQLGQTALKRFCPPETLAMASSDRKGLKAINLSLASACGADCIFCPADRGQRIRRKVMPLHYVHKIVTEISSDAFKAQHSLEKIEVGENGDASLNKNFIEILRLIKDALPHVHVEYVTNFQNLNEDKANIILREKLIDSIICNIDGSSADNYFNVKRLELDQTWTHLEYFINQRDQLGTVVPVSVMVLTLNKYIQTIKKNYDFYPAKLKDFSLIQVPDDFRTTKKKLKGLLNPKKDKVLRSWVFGWAERAQVDTSGLNYQRYLCPLLLRIKREAFIAPDGTWYACCFDSNNELVLGNVVETSINEVFSSDERRDLIRLIEQQQFGRIGGPCKTVNCCQIVYTSKVKTKLAQFVLKSQLRIDRVFG
jgi:MoaA/NifB/PqqE/SkfB family radical SAM enzyme